MDNKLYQGGARCVDKAPRALRVPQQYVNGNRHHVSKVDANKRAQFAENFSQAHALRLNSNQRSNS